MRRDAVSLAPKNDGGQVSLPFSSLIAVTQTTTDIFTPTPIVSICSVPSSPMIGYFFPRPTLSPHLSLACSPHPTPPFPLCQKSLHICLI
jgi:hypothetical protein